MNIIQKTFRAMETDTDGSDNQAQRIIDTFSSCISTEREKINDIFISLCGWSMDTLLTIEDSLL